MKHLLPILALLLAAPAWAEIDATKAGTHCLCGDGVPVAACMQFCNVAGDGGKKIVGTIKAMEKQRVTLQPHTCSLFTVAHNGTVSVVHGLTKKRAEKLARDMKEEVTRTCTLISKDSDPVCLPAPQPGGIDRTEVFCD